MWVPLKEKKKMKSKMKGRRDRRETEGASRENFYFSILFFLLFSKIHGNLTVGFRRVKNEKCSTRRGLRVGTKNIEFHLEFR